MAKTILLADDSVTIQKVVELTFMDEDYQVVAVSDGQEALDRLDEVAPDLVIADVHMPHADGYEVCRQIKASHPSIPVLLLVGTFEQFDEDQASEAKADGHLKKPFDSQDLLAQVESLIVRSAAAAPATGVPPAIEPGADESHAPGEEPSADRELFNLEGTPAGVDELEPPPLVYEGTDAGSDDVAAADSAKAFDLVPEPEAEASPPEVEPAPAQALGAESTETAAITLEAPTLEAPRADGALAEAPAAETAAFESRPAVPELAAAAEPASATGNGSRTLSDEDVERIAKRVAELVGEKTLREVAWEVVPDLAEVIIKERIRELESQVE